MARNYRGTKKEERALAAYVKLMRASDSIYSESTRDLADYNLSGSQFAVLEALSHVGPLVLSELARKVLKTGGNITMVVDNLEKRGLVRRVASREDRRYIKAEVTAAGRKLIDSMFPAHVQRIVQLMSRLTGGEQDQLSALCRKLGKGSPAAG
jgi:MarR family transcriptional regulator, 2-MHQ and catechol-resistance regulon repressor